jgi:hypothetical protein
MSKTANKFSPEVRERAIRMVLEDEDEHSSQPANTAGTATAREVASLDERRLAWTAFKNMLRAAARDRLWPFVSLSAAPFRIWKPLLGVLFILAMALFAIGLGGRFVLQQMGFGVSSISFPTMTGALRSTAKLLGRGFESVQLRRVSRCPTGRHR